MTALAPKRFFPAVGSTSRYRWDWRKYLVGLNTEISSFAVVADPLLTVVSAAQEFGAGVPGVITAYITVPPDENKSYTVSCTITTSGGDTTTRSILIVPVVL